MEHLDQFDRLITSLSPSEPLNLLSAVITFAIGYTQYTYAVRLVLREHKGPLPLWMHSFYLAHDSTWSLLCGRAAPLYGDHWLLRGFSTALGVWAAVEVFCIYKALTVEREEVFGRMFKKKGGGSMAQVLTFTGLLQAVMYGVVWLFISFVGYDGIFQWFAFTNVLIVVGPTTLWLERGSRDGLSLGLALTNVACAVSTFTPFGMWVRALPEIFDNDVFYATGVAVFAYSVYMFCVVARYPAKARSKSGETQIW